MAAQENGSPDPVTIQEKDGVHKAWYAEARAVKTVEEFVTFHNKLMDGYLHDYGTICHAIACLSLAGACLANSHPQAHITGFQAGAVMWQWLEGWGTGPKNMGRILDYEDMLFPMAAHKFNTISTGVWTFLQKRAEENLKNYHDQVEGFKNVNPAVLQHWRDITNGVVPFNFIVEE